MSGPSGHSGHSGHTVLAVPVPALDPFVRARTAEQDAAYLGRDAHFVNAHVTILGPWLAEPTEDDLATVAAIVAGQLAWEIELAEVAEFADGILHLVAEPAATFAALTERVAAAFPQTPPYAGAFEVLVPHLTLDHRVTGASLASLRAELADLLPVRTVAERLDVQWWAPDDCHVRASWRFGGPAGRSA